MVDLCNLLDGAARGLGERDRRSLRHAELTRRRRVVEAADRSSAIQAAEELTGIVYSYLT